MPSILYLEDDKLLAQSVIDELEDAEYSVTWTPSSDEVVELTFENSYDIYLFDVNVEGENGFELLKSLRESGDTTPTLFITSLNQIQNIKEGFSVGADDYIKKPFDLDELLIRIEAKLPQSKKFQLSENFIVDVANQTIQNSESEATLPSKEFAILHYFLINKGELSSAEEIINEIYPDKPISLATFRTYIKNIKRHIEGVATIENVKGVGYRLKVL